MITTKKDVLNGLLFHVTHDEKLLRQMVREIAISDQDESQTHKDFIEQTLHQLYAETCPPCPYGCASFADNDSRCSACRRA